MADNASCQNNLKMARRLGPGISYVRLLMPVQPTLATCAKAYERRSGSGSKADICGALYDVHFQELSGSVESTSRVALLEAGAVPFRPPVCAYAGGIFLSQPLSGHGLLIQKKRLIFINPARIPER